MKKLLEDQIQARETDGVPITQKLKVAGDPEPLPAVKPRKWSRSLSSCRRIAPEPKQNSIGD
ncbi:hypothetical protein [Salipiger mucosus]|uniref:Uncharacterized protein n=1 Tax=Salipiger mucosus DSM 16094 TaxID=1123237 RepID=S9RVN3_9RHOB|nr:hypothetical protein [Salipiger mucosus]EPX78039.1 hypothetical protein Salmuc_03361 [Salipiger mucosus DSM 16094]